MIRLAAVIFCFILCLNGSLADPNCLDNEELASTCGSYCFSVMKPVLGYVKANQQKLETCEKGSEPNLSQINKQLSDLKDTLGYFIQSLESRERYRSEREILSNRLDTIENQLLDVLDERTSLQNQINNIHKALTLKARLVKKEDKLYKVDNKNTNKNCEEMGGKLASIKLIDEEIGFRSLNNLTKF